ncbi:hypothetical protein ACROYT_G031184 [Oculina patagonica]
MTHTTAELLTREVIQTGKIPTGNPFGRPTIPPQKQILLFLWTMATQEGTREIADRFNVTYSSVSRTVVRVMKAVCELKNQYIRWPNGNEINEVKADFGDTFPGVIGAIDGTLIHIRCPSENKEAYNCRKRFHALNVQVVCDNQMVFRDVLAGWPGSVHDSRILRNSLLWQNSAAKFPGDTHLLGDGGYPLTRWLMVPFRDNGHLTRQQIRFNEILSTLRQVVERAIGLLKGRWRKLQYLNLLSVKHMTMQIMAACVLHNFCLLHDDFDEGYFLDDDDDSDDDGDVDHSLVNGRVCRLAEQKRAHMANLM